MWPGLASLVNMRQIITHFIMGVIITPALFTQWFSNQSLSLYVSDGMAVQKM